MKTTKTIRTKVYKLSALNEDVQKTAHEKWLTWFDYPWSEENKGSLRKFESIFPVKIKDFEYGYRSSIDWKFTENDNIEDLKGLRLRTYIWNNYRSDLYNGKYYSGKYRYDNEGKLSKVFSRRSKVFFENDCTLTGYYMDNYILGPIYEFLRKPNESTTFYDLMNDCLHEWIKGCNEDYEDRQSFESFQEDAEANDYWFTIEGKRI